jgi:hypothetical protein
MSEILKVCPELVDHVALAIAQEIGWGTFSHFNPDDMRRISSAAIEAITAWNQRIEL